MKITLIAALSISALVGCAHMGGAAGTSRVCPAVYAPHLCIATVHNTEERASFAAHGTNKCEALKKLSTVLDQAGVSLDTVVIKCGEVLE